MVRELSNGKLEVYPLKEASEDKKAAESGYENLELYPWLIEKNMETKKNEPGKVFVLVPQEDYEILGDKIWYFDDPGRIIFENEQYRIYGFDSSMQILNHIR